VFHRRQTSLRTEGQPKAHQATAATLKFSSMSCGFASVNSKKTSSFKNDPAHQL
jgi:hypothetical protein